MPRPAQPGTRKTTFQLSPANRAYLEARAADDTRTMGNMLNVILDGERERKPLPESGLRQHAAA